MATAPTPALEVSVEIDAPPEVVWRLVSDVRRTGEWSPECRKVIVWGRGRLRKGTKLTGFNRRKYAVWATTSRIHLYDEGRAIGWTVLEHRSQWSYHVAADGGGRSHSAGRWRGSAGRPWRRRSVRRCPKRRGVNVT